MIFEKIAKPFFKTTERSNKPLYLILLDIGNLLFIQTRSRKTILHYFYI